MSSTPITHCPRGHEYTEENTMWYGRPGRGRGTFRACKKCNQERAAANRKRLLHCPFCKKITHPRSGPVMPGIPRAVLADGTCDFCWRTEIRGKVRTVPASEEKAQREIESARKSLDAWFRERRARGINPAGNAELDAIFEADTKWEKGRLHRRRQEENVMDARTFAQYLERDGGVCLHCGTDQGLVPQHRRNRGMGGSPSANIPSNIIVLCSTANGLMESNANWAQKGRDFGWKVTAREDPYTIPVYDATANRWYLLFDDFTREEVPAPWQMAVNE